MNPVGSDCNVYQIRVIPSDAPVQAQLDRYAGRGWHWIVLVDDHSHHSAWQARLLASRERIVDKLGINGIAQELRDAFIQSIAHANTRITRPEWFCSRPSERNPLASTMFQDTCRAEAILRKASDLERIVVVTDAPGVGLALSEVRAPEYQIVIAFPVTNGPSRVQCLKQFAAFLLGAAIKRFQAPPISKHPPDVLIHSHAGATAVSSASVSDQVFPGLALNLTAQGKTVWTMKYLPASRHLRKYWRKMLRDDTQPFCEYSLYHLSDFVYVWHAANRMRTLEIELQPADRIPLSRLARQELHTSAFDPGVLEALLRTRLGRRLREREIMPATVIMEFENMILERGLIYGFRKDLPRTKLIGY